jgi:hypothetical protein
MPTADMTRLMDHCRVRLPGALDTAIKQEMFSALDHMLQTTHLWYEDITFTANPTLDTYEQNPAAYTYPLTPTSGGIVRLLGLVDDEGVPRGGSIPTIPDLILAYPPAETRPYIARVALTVADTDVDGFPELPDWIVKKYQSKILDGVLGRMMSQIAKPYSSQQMAVTHLRLFNSFVQRAKVEALRENVHASQRWLFPQSFNRR